MENKPLRRLDERPQPTYNLVRDRLAHPVTVSHETIRGDIQRFEAVIERVYWFDRDGTAVLAFRGKAASGDWTGHKTFFADMCRDMVDGVTNEPIHEVTAWLLELDDPLTPITPLALWNAVRAYAEREYGLEIGGAKLLVDADGDAVRAYAKRRAWEYADGVDHAGTVVGYQNVTWKDGQEPPELLFFVLPVVVQDENTVLGVEPIQIILQSISKRGETVQIADGVTSTRTAQPLVDKLECIPYAGGHIEVSRRKRG